MSLYDNDKNHSNKHLAYGLLFWFSIILIFLLLASCRAKKTTVETSSVETKEIVKDSVIDIEKSEVIITKSVPVHTGNFYPYDSTRKDNPIFENEIDNGTTKVKISSTNKGLLITTESIPVENKESTHFKGIKQNHNREKENITEKTWYQKIIAIPIYFKWWFWLLIIAAYLVLRFYIRKITLSKKIIDTIENNND
ncbi:hypothetical protein FLJC2902T_17600 [Flavobacterium limnosediminis JC2902]|uniref:Uncharacterized protein n=1 Tax=Flavobacterium limnosediminis JC2902 TaxID=1341181 RepID=V6SP52_9FLAO|nr:hypothetical protein [Flavobacterium limnosediminis]ESU28401.1 hypothetical protein FLJC2902T_17600 [Flavobacterium limnosediminis JC2902]